MANFHEHQVAASVSNVRSSHLYICLAALLLSAHGASAQNAAIEEVVVTATKRGETLLQDTALAITAFTEESLRLGGSRIIEDLAGMTPGLAVTSNSNAFPIISIRGLGTNYTFAGGETNTTVQVDGVYLARPSGAAMDLADVERVEVLRGPQGTLYGRNAIAGTINVITRQPTDELEGEISAAGGNYDQVRVAGRVSGPLVEDRVLASFAASYGSRDGYIEQLTTTSDDLWDEDRVSARGRLKFLLSENLTATVGVDYFNAEELSNFYTVRLLPLPISDGFNPDYDEAAINGQNTADNENWGVFGRIEWQGNDLTITSITAWRESDVNLTGDLDGTALSIVHTRAFPEKQDQFSQELNISGAWNSLDYVVGLYYFQEDVSSFYNAEFPGAIPTPFGPLDLLVTNGVAADTDSIAGFGQGTWHLNDQWALTAGIRYTHDSKDGLNTPGVEVGFLDPTEDPATRPPVALLPEVNRSFSAWTPKFGIEFRPLEDLLLYASATRGFKSGGFNINTSTDALGAPIPDPFDAELVWTYEGGIKYQFPGRRATANLVGFYYDYEDYQVAQFMGTATEVIQNADKVTVSGMELEAAVLLTERLTAGGYFAWLQAEYDSPFLTVDAATRLPVDADGNRLNDAPEISGAVYGQYTFPWGSLGTFSVRGEAQYKDSVFYSSSNNIFEYSDDYWLLNAGLVFTTTDERWEASLVARNLADEEYISGTVNFATVNGRPGIPRTLVGTLRYRF